MTKRVTEREQSIMGRIFFIFKVNTVEKGPEGPFPIRKISATVYEIFKKRKTGSSEMSNVSNEHP